ncbi:MAG: ferrous iron transport protein B [Gemmatimonadota bacterium]
MPAATSPRGSACEGCARHLEQLGIDLGRADHIVALAGNPNTGKSTVFNALTGLRQHVGNWPGKTVARAEGGMAVGGRRFKLVDLPGTYSLLSAAAEEEVARDFLLFGRPDCVVVVVDATALERNLNLVLQVLHITDRVVVCLNLVDEARRKGIEVDHRALARQLGVPVVPTAALRGEGMSLLVRAIEEMACGETPTKPLRAEEAADIANAVDEIERRIRRLAPELPRPRWAAMRILDGDPSVEKALRSGEFASRDPGALDAPGRPGEAESLARRADELRRSFGGRFRDLLVESTYRSAERIARRTVRTPGSGGGPAGFEARIDRIVTSRVWGLPVMFAGLAVVFWITIVGANVPSAVLARLLFGFEEHAAGLFATLGSPDWLTGFLWHGVFRGLAWVVSVMLPPMAIFFPIFTVLENLGYLPRVAFNMDWLFRRVGAHGKQTLTMSMGFGCNAAGVIACRVIESPRERLVAILTNNFVPCNGRFPTLIMIATVFLAARFPPAWASMAAAGAVVGAVLLGVVVTLASSWGLTRTLLRGEPSTFVLELPPYRRPKLGQILYTSLIDRTFFVLRRAVYMAAPAGGLIWLLAHVSLDGGSLATTIAAFLDPLGRLMGLDGVILLAYVIAIPANEIVVPTMLMTYAGSGMLTDVQSLGQLHELLVVGHGWTLLTAVSLMVFCVLHNPCSTTILTIWKETGSRRWAAIGGLLPLAIGVLTTVLIAAFARAVLGA